MQWAAKIEESYLKQQENKWDAHSPTCLVKPISPYPTEASPRRKRRESISDKDIFKEGLVPGREFLQTRRTSSQRSTSQGDILSEKFLQRRTSSQRAASSGDILGDKMLQRRAYSQKLTSQSEFTLSETGKRNRSVKVTSV